MEIVGEGEEEGEGEDEGEDEGEEEGEDEGVERLGIGLKGMVWRMCLSEGKGSRDGKNWIDGWGEVEKMRRVWWKRKS